MIVMKFGGTSVGGAEPIAQATQIVRGAVTGKPAKMGGTSQTFESPQPVVVVVSAMSGVTDSLVKAATSAAGRDGQTFRQVKESLLDRHRAVLESVVGDGEARSALLGEIETLLHEFESLCQSIYILGELTARGLDAVSSLGERLLVRIFAAALRGLGVEARPLEATTLIVTDDNYGGATPLMDETRARVQANLTPLLAEGITPVVTGFIGATPSGIVTTLGRGGSDYTAAILGHCLDSREIWIWTDVDGIMTANPRVVPEARTLPAISYAEAAELSYFGAKVLHPKTILPALEKGIPIRIVNTFNPGHPGTLVVAEAEPTDKTVKAITAIKRLSLVTVEGRGMIGVPGIAAKVFSAVAREGISVLMISQSSSEQNICFVIQQEANGRALRALENEFELELARRNIDRIWAQGDVAIVAVVGAGMKGTPGIGAKVFGALGRNAINVISVAQGSSEYNISLVVDERDVDDAVRYIHQEFELGG
ncbi:MAG TPA: aspartate kinase [Anaerolineae bacterium]|nr:aspartate kinase [Anaerolineae bacterium]